MNRFTASLIFEAIAFAIAIIVPLAIPSCASAQTSKQSIQGTWVNHTGLSRMTMTFHADGTYSMVYEDAQGRRLNDTGRYLVTNQTVFTTSTDGSSSRLYFFWINPTMATIRVAPDAAPHQHVEATFVRK
ncbi:MAG: copper resistance protein NlpE [Planctomycetes bacterium]|nr:copper resistance protein NlpE [Planctomycetota bacterium]